MITLTLFAFKSLRGVIEGLSFSPVVFDVPLCSLLHVQVSVCLMVKSGESKNFGELIRNDYHC